MPSANKTANVGLNQWQGNEYPKRQDFNDDNLATDTKFMQISDDITSHKADDMKHIDYAVASGADIYTATIANITALTEGLSVKIKLTNANTGASTLNINNLGAKDIKKGNGNALASGNIKAGQICHLVYTGSVFQLLGEGGEYGTATTDKVLAPYTIGTDNGLANGTMPNNGVFNLGLGVPVPAGYYTGGTTANGKKYAYGDSQFSINAYSDYTVSGLPFVPKTIILNCTNDTFCAYFKIKNNVGSEQWVPVTYNKTGYQLNVAAEPLGTSFTIHNGNGAAVTVYHWAATEEIDI